MYTEAYLKSIVDRFDNENVSDDELVDLITKIAESGERIQLSETAFDFASTGGPSSLSTLLVPLFLFSYGVNVINLAVPGRPAGAVDVLAQIPGYNLSVQTDCFKTNEHFYVHLEANERYVPLDKCLFEFRQKINKVNVPNLVIASILSKKAASGAGFIGLDVRMSSFGNFGRTWQESIAYSRKYNHIASLLHLKSTCFISDGNIPYQKYIGRGESLLALYEILYGHEDDKLQNHVSYCKYMAEEMINRSYIGLDTQKNSDLKSCFEDNLDLQGSSAIKFEEAVKRVNCESRVIVRAERNGYIKYDMSIIRSIIKTQQAKFLSEARYPDPCGVILLADTGSYVEKGQPVMSVRSRNKEIIKSFEYAYSILMEPFKLEIKHEVI